MQIARTCAIAAALAGFSAHEAPAQILRKIGQKASDAVERKAEQKVDQKIAEAADRLVNRSFDAVFGDGNPTSDTKGGRSSGGTTGSTGASRVFAMLPNAPTESRYDFDVVFTYEIESTSKGRAADDKVQMMMHFSTAGNYTGTRIVPKERKKGDGELFAIFDVKNESMVMLFDAEDGKFSMAYGWHDAKRFVDSTAAVHAATPARPTGGQPATATPTATYSSLGKRNIAGYACDGFRSETAEGVADVWVSTDPALSYSRMMAASASMKQVKTVMPASYPTGMLMETLVTDKKTGDQSRMTVTSVNRSAGVRIDMQQYPRIGSKK